MSAKPTGRCMPDSAALAGTTPADCQKLAGPVSSTVAPRAPIDAKSVSLRAVTGDFRSSELVCVITFSINNKSSGRGEQKWRRQTYSDMESALIRGNVFDGFVIWIS
jgi:hypothetical protein